MVLDYANPDSVAKCIRSVTHTLHQLRNQLLEQGRLHALVFFLLGFGA